MNQSSMLAMCNLIFLAFSLTCAVFAAKRPAKPRGFFSLPPALRGVLAFVLGPTLIGSAIILWPVTLFIWYVRRRNLANYIDNSQMLAQLRNQGQVTRK